MASTSSQPPHPNNVAATTSTTTTATTATTANATANAITPPPLPIANPSTHPASSSTSASAVTPAAAPQITVPVPPPVPPPPSASASVPATTTAASVSDEEANARHLFFLSQRDLPPLPDTSPHVWNKQNEKQLRSALIGACKRMPKNSEAHFHLGLMYMRSGDFQHALRSFQHARNLTIERYNQYQANNIDPPSTLKAQVARVRSHCAQAAHLVALLMERDKHAEILQKTQKELIASIGSDCASPDTWNALGLIHLNEGGNANARDIYATIRHSFPDYLDALNNVGVAELALGHEQVAISCFQKVLLCDREHVEALSNYAVILLRHGMYDAAIRAFNSAVKGAPPDARGLPFAWGGLAIAHAALGQLDTADNAARRAELSAPVSNRSRFAMLRASIYVRRVSYAYQKGLSWDPFAAAFNSSDRVQPTSADEADEGDGGSHSGDPGDQEDPSDADGDDVDAENAPANMGIDSGANANASADMVPNQHAKSSFSAEKRARDHRDRKRDKSRRQSQFRSSTGQIQQHSYINSNGSGIDKDKPSSGVLPSHYGMRDASTAHEDADPRAAIDGAVLRLRALARDLKSSSASTALGAALRLRHHFGTEDTNNRNFGAEAAERLVEALEMDHNDATAWVQLGLLQIGTGEYSSAKDFSVQAVSRNGNVEAGWNALAVASQLHHDAVDASTAYETALNVIRANYSKSDRWPRPDGTAKIDDEHQHQQGCDVDGVTHGRNDEANENRKSNDVEIPQQQQQLQGSGSSPTPVRRLVFPLPDGEGGGGGTGNEDRITAVVDGQHLVSSSTKDRMDIKTEQKLDDVNEINNNNDETDEDVKTLNAAGRNALAAVYNNIGNLRRQEGRSFSEALSAYQKSLKVGGEHPVVYNNLALLYISSNRLQEAGEMLDHALKLDPKLQCAISNRLKLTALMQKRESSSDAARAGGYNDDFLPDSFAVNFDNDGGMSSRNGDDDDGEDEDDDEEEEEEGEDEEEEGEDEEEEEDLMDLGEDDDEEEGRDEDVAMNQDERDVDDDAIRNMHDDRNNDDDVNDESEGGDSCGNSDPSWNRRQRGQ